MNKLTNFLVVLTCLIAFSCKRGPKIISSPVHETSNAKSNSTGIFADGGENPIVNSERSVTPDGVHTVKVLEVLPTEKYVYMKVVEKGEEFWVATGKKDIQVGESYFYKNGILKTNFESKEYDRVFDKVYLVSNIVPVNHSTNAGTSASSNSADITPITQTANIEVEGSIKIAEIVSQPEKYAGQTVQVSGRCSKLNPNIMGRNWIHLQDGSQDDFDLVVTSEIAVPEGHMVTMTGKVVLDKDFGAGYKYAIIIEDGQIVKLN